jgi:RAB protein geranylgeranyltransferase component A
MDPTLKDEVYDVIIVGTGMVESILAGYVHIYLLLVYID